MGVSLPDVLQRSRAALRVGDAAEARRLLADVSEPASGEVLDSSLRRLPGEPAGDGSRVRLLVELPARAAPKEAEVAVRLLDQHRRRRSS